MSWTTLNINAYTRADLALLFAVVDQAGAAHEFTGTNVINVYRRHETSPLLEIELTWDGTYYTGSVAEADLDLLATIYRLEWINEDTTSRVIATGNFTLSDVYVDNRAVAEATLTVDTTTYEITVSDSDTAATAALAAQAAAEAAQTAAQTAEQNAKDLLLAISDPITILTITITYDGGWEVEVDAIGGYGDFTGSYQIVGTDMIVTVEDAIGNEAEEAIDLTTENPITISDISSVWNEGTATITVTASGGFGNLEYRMDSGEWQSSNIFEVGETGTYTIEVKDEPQVTTASDTHEVEPDFSEAEILANAYIDRVMAEPYSLIGAGITSVDWQDVTFDAEGVPDTNYDAAVGLAAVVAEYERLLAQGMDNLEIRWGHEFGLTLEAVEVDAVITWCVKKAYDLSDGSKDISEASGANMPVLTADGFLFNSARSTKLMGDYVHAGATPIRTEMTYKLTVDAVGYIYSVGGNSGIGKGWRQLARGDWSHRMQFEYRDGSTSSTLNSTTNYNLNGTELVSLITWNGVTGGTITINKDGAFNADGVAERQWADSSFPAYAVGCHRAGDTAYASHFTGYIKGHQINSEIL
jgi:hypothetical protein